MRKNTIFTVAVAGVLLTSSLSSAPAAENVELKSFVTPDGRERIYGLVSPLDQEGRNFYLLTSERQVEVRWAKDGPVGLLFLQSDIQVQLERREIAVADTGQRFRLPEGGTGTSSASISATGTRESPRRITRRTWKA